MIDETALGWDANVFGGRLKTLSRTFFETENSIWNDITNNN